MDVVILTAGRGERLQPLTNYIHKALIPLHSRPLLGYTIENLIALREPLRIILVLNHLADQIVDFFNRYYPGLKVYHAYQPVLRGTAHAVLTAQPWVIEDEFLVICADEVVSPFLVQELFAHRGNVIAAAEVTDPYNHVHLAVRGNLLHGFYHRPTEVANGWVLRGVWKFDQRIWPHLDTRVVGALETLIDEVPVQVVCWKEPWIQIGDHEGYRGIIRVARELGSSYTSITGVTLEDCEIRRSVVFGEGTLRFCRLYNSVVYVRGGVEGKTFQKGLFVV